MTPELIVVGLVCLFVGFYLGELHGLERGRTLAEWARQDERRRIDRENTGDSS